MASTITSSGSGSGNDFESIISASVEAKRAQYTKNTTNKKETKQLEKQGVDTFTTALKTFKDKCDELTKDNSMNTHKVTTSQSTDYQAFSVTTKDDCVNTSFELSVEQLAKAESVNQKFTTADGFSNSFSAGKLTIDLGTETYKDEDGLEQTRERQFTVDINEGDTLELIRKRINKNDYDLNVGLVKTEDGYSLSITSGTTGKDTSQLSISVDSTDTEGHDSLNVFAFDKTADTTANATTGALESNGNSSWNYNEGKDAIITVDGQKVTSHTNDFDDGQVSGVDITVNKLSERETVGGVEGYKTYSVDVTSDVDAAKTKMQGFIDAYNTLMTSMDTLYKRNTYTDGTNNYDGGDLSGDSQLKSIQNTIQSMIVRFEGADSGKTLFDCGLEYGKDGTLSLDSTKFKDAIKNSFNSVVNLFTGDDGLLDNLSTFVKDYTQTGGLLAERTESIDKEISSWESKEKDNEDALEKYEASLRTKYGNLDSLMSSYNTSLSYISSILG